MCCIYNHFKFLKEINVIQQGCIKSIKSDSKEFVTLLQKIISNKLTLYLKKPEKKKKKVSWFAQKY